MSHPVTEHLSRIGLQVGSSHGKTAAESA